MHRSDKRHVLALGSAPQLGRHGSVHAFCAFDAREGQQYRTARAAPGRLDDVRTRGHHGLGDQEARPDHRPVLGQDPDDRRE
ncbi:hypothetical protein [Streptomyces sp. NPDC086989]|uniref:hypothetical protein n=1 Tax=Streptomyces sp. NPDC086989 TaxID=3365764 RepID=UPI0038158DF3